jgi:hypothetical protein
MKICSEEMAAIVFGAGAPGGFGGYGGGGSSGGGFGGASSNVSCAGPSASSTGAAAAGTIVGNSINGDGSFQNGLASLVGGLVAWGVEVGTLAATRNPLVAATSGVTAGTIAVNYVNSLEGFDMTPHSGVGLGPPANSHGWNTDGKGAMSGGSEAGTSARDGMGFGGTGSGI